MAQKMGCMWNYDHTKDENKENAEEENAKNEQ